MPLSNTHVQHYLYCRVGVDRIKLPVLIVANMSYAPTNPCSVRLFSNSLSYKGEKDKKDFIRDLIDYSLVLPTIELHNRTCRWLDLIIIIRNTAKTALLSQAIKQKLQIKSTTTTTASIPLPVGNAEGAGGSGIAGSGGAGSSKLEVRSETSEEQARLLLFGTMVSDEAPSKQK